MWEKYYLLDLSVLKNDGMEPSKQCAMKKEMEALLDRERLLKYRRKQEMGAMQSLGAGLLIQLALDEYGRAGDKMPKRETEDFTEPRLRRDTPQTVLEALRGKRPIEAVYCYGPEGKPYFQEIPLYFSLSHSGDAVFLAVSEREIGADIQAVTKADWKKLAKRFYGENDLKYMESCGENPVLRADDLSENLDAREMFYRIWTKKEAYGKLTGEGVPKYLDREVPGKEQGIDWNCSRLLLGGQVYFLAVCGKRSGGEMEKDQTAQDVSEKEKAGKEKAEI